MRDKSKLTIGIVFLLFSIYFVFNIFTKDLESYYITGIIVFTLLGIGFIRNSRY